MSHDEPWQVFALNGEAEVGRSARRKDFTDDLIMGASHLWIWRRNNAGKVEVLLQKRALSKKTWPGYDDISAAGHIDAGETPIESAVREAKEEIGLDVDPQKLYYIFSLRTPLVLNEIDHVYLYESPDNFVPSFDDGEVESTEWLSLDELRVRTSDPEKYHLVDQGDGYFSLLLSSIEKL